MSDPGSMDDMRQAMKDVGMLDAGISMEEAAQALLDADWSEFDRVFAVAVVLYGSDTLIKKLSQKDDAMRPWDRNTPEMQVWTRIIGVLFAIGITVALVDALVKALAGQ